MTQDTAFGEAELTTYMKVERKNGQVAYFKVVNGLNTEISEKEYKENN